MDPLLMEAPGQCHVGCGTDGVFMLFAYLTKTHGTLHTFDVIKWNKHDVTILLRHILMVLYFAMKERVPVTQTMVEQEPLVLGSAPLEDIDEEDAGAPPAASGSQPPTGEIGSRSTGRGTSLEQEGKGKRAPLALIENRFPLTHHALNLHNSKYE